MEMEAAPARAAVGATGPPAAAAALPELDADAFVHCCRGLSARDVVSLAGSCRRLRDLAYSEAVWLDLCRRRWPAAAELDFRGGRAAFKSRLAACQQLRFRDPDCAKWRLDDEKLPEHVLIRADGSLAIAEGNLISTWWPDFNAGTAWQEHCFDEHTARVSCLRSVPATSVASARAGTNDLLLSASYDHTIRVWKASGEGGSLRTLRGHTAGVTTLADGILGSGAGPPVIASGSEDWTVRLWNITGSSKGRSPLLGTLQGHQGPVVQLAVAEYNPSFLVSAAYENKVRVWDASCCAPLGTSRCLGSACVQSVPLALHCEGSTCHIATGAAVVLVDLRTLSQCAIVPAYKPSVSIRSLAVCGTTMATGTIDKAAQLWDLRALGSQSTPLAIMTGHRGPVSMLHLDSYKLVSGGKSEQAVHVWDSNTGNEITQLSCALGCEEEDACARLVALAVQGPKVVLTTRYPAGVIFRDYSNSCTPLGQVSPSDEGCHSKSKFWETTPD
eukprot:SM000018S03583  [mRNA]  locus=s18:160230:163334:- [translate_table: standard]